MSEETKTGDDETKAGPSEVDVGVRPAAFETWQSTRVNFHGFKALTTTKGESVASPEFTCLGHRWYVDIFPGGVRIQMMEMLQSISIAAPASVLKSTAFSLFGIQLIGNSESARSHVPFLPMARITGAWKIFPALVVQFYVVHVVSIALRYIFHATMSEETKTGDREPGPTAEVDVGVRPAAFQTWQSTRVNFHGFEALTTTKGECVDSPEFTCLGHNWYVSLYPGGANKSIDGNVGVFLHCLAGEHVGIDAVFIVRDSAHWKVKGWRFTHVFPPDNDEYSNEWGCPDYLDRSTLTKALIGGTLVLEVRMKYHVRPNVLSAPFIPKNRLLPRNIVDIFMDENSSDVVFEVSEQEVKKTRKRAKTGAPTKFHAHRFVLQRSESLLAELCEAKATSIPISGMKPAVFENMLYYLYGGDLYYSEEEIDVNAWKDLIDAADKYGVVSLKLEAEARYVQLTTLATENALDNLLYADSKNLALLKEAVMDFIVENGDEVMEKVSFEDLPGSIVRDLWAAVNRGKKKESDGTSDKNYSNMRVSGLRDLLDNAGLDVDGSREAMVARCKESDEKLYYPLDKDDDAGSDASDDD